MLKCYLGKAYVRLSSITSVTEHPFNVSKRPNNNNKHLSQNNLIIFQVLNLPTDRPRPTVMKYDGAWVRFELRPGLVTSLRQFIKTEQVKRIG